MICLISEKDNAALNHLHFTTNVFSGVSFEPSLFVATQV